MGCHTWCYLPLDNKQVKKEAISYIELRISKDSNETYVRDLISKMPQMFNKEYFKSSVIFCNRWLRRIKSNHPLWQAAIYSYRFHIHPCIYNNGVFYITYRELNDVFRLEHWLTKTYPEDLVITSLEQLYEYLQSIGQNTSCLDDCKDKLKWLFTNKGVIKFS